MRKLLPVLCLLCLLLLIPALMKARQILPMDTRPLVAEKYAGWSGVLDLWIYEGWPCGSGSIAPWLNRCIADFEKAHPGVYIQPRFVDAGAITTLNDSGISPPDMLLFPPNLLSSPTGLTPLAPSERLRPALSDAGLWRGSYYAVPVAMGGYLWAWNTGLIDALPNTWSETDAILAVPEPEPYRHWDAALLALCAGRYAPTGDGFPSGSPQPLQDGLDLGLPSREHLTPSPPPTDSATLARRLPRSFQWDSEAWRHFINGEAAAMPVTQREIRKLQALSEQGKGPSWQLERGDAPFTDQLLCLSIVDRPTAADRQQLSKAFLTWLLADECQSRLVIAAAFGVTEVSSGYSQGDPLAMLDAQLRAPDLCVPPVFGGERIQRAEEIVRKFTFNSEEAATLWPLFVEALCKKAND